MNKVEICPSILSADFFNLGGEIKELEKEKINVLHFDVMDGHFVPNISLGSCVLESIVKNSSFFLDVHLMLERPLKFIEDFAKKGASGLTFHIESLDDPLECIKKIKDLNLSCGLAVSPSTKLEDVYKYLDLIDMLLIMTVRPGFSGQSFIEEMLEKVKKAAFLKPSLKIEVDGGIEKGNISKAFKSGASWFVAGSFIFNSKDIAGALRELKLALKI